MTPTPLTPERITRNWEELLQELRVTETGAQILTGFLLTVPFNTRFTDLSGDQRTIYGFVLAGSVLTTAFVVAPAAFHRALFRHRARPWLVRAAHQCARAGLALLAITISGVLLLVFDVVYSTAAGVAAGAMALVLLTGLWFVLPRLLGRSEPDIKVGGEHP